MIDVDVWAPRASSVTLRIAEEDVAMRPRGRGWWTPSVEVPTTGGLDYGYLLDGDETPLPDPRSRRQPDGVHALSRTYDPAAFGWTDQRWTGRQLAGSCIYELHVGTFTPEGTLDAAVGKLDHLVDLGVDFVELLPVNSFNGTHNWGYDGVLWFAVDETYGGPEAYQRFVDDCHARGLAVVQDVVYNHLGPSGNYLPRFGPYLHDENSNSWGSSINLDEPEVRRYILDNALMWLRDLHVDGLRLDAVHALVDISPKHVLQELAEEVAVLSASLRRPLTLIAESDLNDPKLVTSREAGGYGLDAQWSDDFHHAVHTAVTGETTGYYADFAPLGALAKVLEHGFFHDGTYSSFRGRNHGAVIDTTTIPASRLVVADQNHDQIGNRATGERMGEMVDADHLAVAAVLTLTSPFTPMLFMGEEWGASTPWQFFTSHPEPELGKATAEGRIKEFEQMGWDPDVVPDPQDPATFQRSKLDWDELEQPDHARLLALYRSLLQLRRERPELTDPRFATTRCTCNESERTVVIQRGALRVVVNLADTPAQIEVDVVDPTVLLATRDDVVVAAGTRNGAAVRLPGCAAVVVVGGVSA